ncbi:MAG: hypothetical protein GY928_38850 [Colwellia sp.]|nr:hypothetical protein [Colwellia sp.]
MVSYEKALNFIKTTKTLAGLKIKAHFVEKSYEKNVTISDKENEKYFFAKA